MMHMCFAVVAGDADSSHMAMTHLLCSACRCSWQRSPVPTGGALQYYQSKGTNANNPSLRPHTHTHKHTPSFPPAPNKRPLFFANSPARQTQRCRPKLPCPPPSHDACSRRPSIAEQATTSLPFDAVAQQGCAPHSRCSLPRAPPPASPCTLVD